MNIFSTDHPMMFEPLRLSRRVRRWLLISALAYPIYLILLGPYYALDGRGMLNFAPEPVRNAVYVPAFPLFLVPDPINLYEAYLDDWYDDPNAPETTW